LRLIAGLCLGLALGAAGGYFYAQKRYKPKDAVVLDASQWAAQQEAVRQQAAALRYTRGQLDKADGELVIERAARQELETQLRASEAEVGRVRDQLAFYEQLLPPGPEGAVDIRGMEVERAGGGLRYRVLLMRSGRPGAPFSGSLRFQATGVLHGETVTVDLQPMQVKGETATAEAGSAQTVEAAGAGQPGPGLMPLQFDQYQRSQGVLALPEGFVPESITVSVLEGDIVRASRSAKLEL